MLSKRGGCSPLLKIIDYSFRNLDDRTLEDNTSDEEDESYSSDGSDSAGETGPALQVCTLLGYQVTNVLRHGLC